MGARDGVAGPMRVMATRIREEEDGAVHHVFARGNRKALVFADDRDRLMYLGLLERTVRHYGWLLLSYCLMSTHLHLLVETQKANLGRGMNWLHGHYGRYFARKIELPGHVFERPYGNRRVKDDEYLWTAVQYIARNPVKAELCERPRDWMWSSHAGVVDGTAPAWVARERLLWYFEGLGGVPLERYAAMVG
jgi:REP-associated tyrosine transposase